jgi:NhaP-type Na+/H+ or K+/H+ antiporter
VTPLVTSVLDSVREALGGASRRDAGTATSTFLRGLAVGALVGAAIAGSTIWERRRLRRRQPPASVDQGVEPER